MHGVGADVDQGCVNKKTFLHLDKYETHILAIINEPLNIRKQTKKNNLIYQAFSNKGLSFW